MKVDWHRLILNVGVSLLWSLLMLPGLVFVNPGLAPLYFLIGILLQGVVIWTAICGLIVKKLNVWTGMIFYVFGRLAVGLIYFGDDYVNIDSNLGFAVIYVIVLYSFFMIFPFSQKLRRAKKIVALLIEDSGLSLDLKNELEKSGYMVRILNNNQRTFVDVLIVGSENMTWDGEPKKIIPMFEFDGHKPSISKENVVEYVDNVLEID